GVLAGAVMVLDRATGRVEHSLVPHEKGNRRPIRALAFAPAGNRVAYGTEYGSVWLWEPGKQDVRLNREPEPDQPNRIRLLTFRDDNRLVSVAEDGRVRQWDLTALGEKDAEVLARADVGPALSIRCAALSKDGQWLALGTKIDARTTEVNRVQVQSVDGRERRG